MKVIELKDKELSELQSAQEHSCLMILKKAIFDVATAEKNLYRKRKILNDFQNQEVEEVEIKATYYRTVHNSKIFS